MLSTKLSLTKFISSYRQLEPSYIFLLRVCLKADYVHEQLDHGLFHLRYILWNFSHNTSQRSLIIRYFHYMANTFQKIICIRKFPNSRITLASHWSTASVETISITSNHNGWSNATTGNNQMTWLFSKYILSLYIYMTYSLDQGK